ncbi:MAG: Ig-like domain-containing protein [Bacteroidaceae bacterium]|nr:Ig-like domain-containing protein [Bacteroidaceae bacterium]
MKRLLLTLLAFIGLVGRLTAQSLPAVTIEKTLTMGSTITVEPWKDGTNGYSNVTHRDNRTDWWTNGTKNDNTVFDVVPTLSSGKTDVYSWAYNSKYKLTAKQGGTHTFTAKMGYNWVYKTVNGIKYSTTSTLEVTYIIRVPHVYRINIPDNASVNVGETLRIYAVTLDMDAPTTLSWSSDDTSVATVAADGTVSGVKAGNATITCTAANGVSSSCHVTVTRIPVSQIVLSSTGIELTQGSTYRLTPTIIPTNATNQKLTWTTSNSSVATVSTDQALVIRPMSVTPIIIDGSSTTAPYTPASPATINAVGAGTATITGYATDGSGASVSCTVTVTEPVSTNTLVSRIELSENVYQCLPVGRTYQLTATVYPEGATDKSVAWSSDDNAVVTVSPSGQITTLGIGSTTIHCKANDGSGVEATCVIDVLPTLVADISLSASACELEQGQTQQLTATVLPTDATVKTVVWHSTDASVATVDGNGLLTGVAPGVATIICRSADGSNVQSSCAVTVVPKKVSSISLNTYSCTIGDTNQLQLVATVAPEDAGNSMVAWSSSDDDIAFVDAAGLVTAMGKGSATITCTAVDGSGVSASCNVTVNAVYIQNFSLYLTACELEVGGRRLMAPVLDPANTTFHSFKWRSSDTSVATVDHNGLVTGVAPGTATITCTLNMMEATFFADPYEKNATCQITVKAAAMPPSTIDFADAEVKRICVGNWDADGDGELSYDEAAAVTDLGIAFVNSEICTFDELQHFVNLERIGGEAVVVDNVSYMPGFGGCRKLSAITLPTRLKEIDRSAFSDCTSLKEIALPSMLQRIGTNAFFYAGLTAINIPQSVTEIGTEPFFGCPIESVSVEEGNNAYDTRDGCHALIETATGRLIVGTTDATIPNTVTTIGGGAFYGQYERRELNIPPSVKTIERCIIRGCNNIAALFIPASVTTIRQMAFDGAGGLESIVVDDSNPTYDSRNNCNAIMETKSNALIRGCKNTVIPDDAVSITEHAFFESNLQSIVIPSSVTTIGYEAFGFCRELESVDIPESVTSIKASAFGYSGNIKEIRVRAKSPVAIPQSCFYGWTNIYQSCILYVPAGSKAAYEAADVWKDFKEILEMPDESGDESGSDVATPDNAIYADATLVLAGNTLELGVRLKNTVSPVGCSFRLTLPEGLRLQTDADGDVAYELSERARKMSLTMKDWNNGSYDFALTPSTATAIISGTDDVVVTFRVPIPDDMPAGQYELLFTRCLIQSKNDSGVTTDTPLSDMAATLTVADCTPGDVNGDGVITPSDAIMTLYHYFSVAQPGFNVKAADTNGDGAITPSDAIETLYLYFGSGKGNAPRREPQ